MEPASHHYSPTPENFIRRTLIANSVVCVLVVLSGITLLFWREYGTSLFQNPDGRGFNLLLQGTLGPIYFGLLLFPISAIVVLVFAVMLFIGLWRRNLYFSVLCFVILGIYWLWLVKLIGEDAFH